MPLDPLALPVRAIARPTLNLSPEDSLARAAHFFRDAPAPFLPVVENGRLAGILRDVALSRAMANGGHWTDSVGGLIEPAPLTIRPDATGAEALRQLGDSGQAATLVVEEDGYLIGVVSVVDLYEVPDEGPRPSLVGGMATPFGVYLTTGSIRAGASDLALVTTGFVLFACFLLSTYFGEGLVALFPKFGRTDQGDFWFRSVTPLVVFLLSFRLMPLAGIHAAEHKVVHAIERDEPLEPEVVKRMPRVHPRCGTNLAVGLSLFVGLLEFNWIPSAEVRLLTAIIVTLFAWRPLGNLVQFLVTTRPPSDKHIAMGIRSGRELLDRYRRERGRPPTLGRRLLASGMVHAMLGSTLAGLVYAGLAKLFGWPLL